MIFHDRKQRIEWNHRMEYWTKRLASGDLTGLRIVYGAFAMGDAKWIRRAGDVIYEQLSAMTWVQQCSLCERFRTFTSLEWTMSWMDVSLDELKQKLSKEAFRYMLILGSFHPNGYFREKCLYAMAEGEGMLCWILPRVNDWVVQIRDSAYTILQNYLASCNAQEILLGLPALERLWVCRRRSGSQMQALDDRIQERLALALQEMDVREIPQMELVVRQALYRIVMRTRLLTIRELDVCFKQEQTACLKKILATGILAHPDCTLEWAKQYLTDPFAQVRRMAVEFWYEHLKTCWAGLEQMLTDSSKGIREYAVYILQRHSDLDIRGYYRERLKDDTSGFAVLGLSEFCRHGNLPELLQSLKSPNRKILKCTLLALGSQEDFWDEELLWGYLFDERADISKAAYWSIRKRDFYLGAERIYRAYQKECTEPRKRYLLYLLLRESSWIRLPYLLRLYHRDLPEQEGSWILSGIRSRSMYGKVTETLYRDICLALEEKRGELPERLEDEIRYDLKILLR